MEKLTGLVSRIKREKKTERIQFRVSPTLKGEIESFCNFNGVAISEFITYCIMKQIFGED